jgi:lysozyme family protein
MPSDTTFEALSPQYRELWDTMSVRGAKSADITVTAKKIVGAKGRYEAVEDALGVPWFVVGAIHAMECGLRFDRHLHNGDPLTARTTHVPKGRPAAKPQTGGVYTWHESAVDALKLHKLEQVTDWSVERICYELERYNGWGYRKFHPETLSPYLWSGTNHYSKGKYVADGKWSATAVSGQSGALAIIKQISELDVSVAKLLPAHAEPDHPVDTIADARASPATPTQDPALEFPKAETVLPTSKEMRATSRKYWLADWVKAMFGTGTVGFATFLSADNITAVKQWADVVKSFVAAYGVPIVIGLLVAGYIATELIQHWMKEDTAEGRYVPSGAEPEAKP